MDIASSLQKWLQWRSRPCFCAVVQSLPLEHDSGLVDNVQLLRYRKSAGYIKPWCLSGWPSLWASWLISFCGASCYCWRRPVAMNRGWIWPIAKEELKLSAQPPQRTESCKQPNSMEVQPSCSCAFRWEQRPWPTHWLSLVKNHKAEATPRLQ